MFLCAYLFVRQCIIPQRPEEGVRCFGIRWIDSCKLLCGSQEPVPGPVEAQGALLLTQPFLQPHLFLNTYNCFLLYIFYLFVCVLSLGVPCVCESQKLLSESLGLELQVWVLGIQLCRLKCFPSNNIEYLSIEKNVSYMQKNVFKVIIYLLSKFRRNSALEATPLHTATV